MAVKLFSSWKRECSLLLNVVHQIGTVFVLSRLLLAYILLDSEQDKAAIMSQYQASIPSDGQVKPEIQKYFETFYQVSDTPDAHEKYSEQFTKNAKLIMGPNESNGRSEILNFRKGMWEKVAKRSHKPIQIYSFGKGSEDVMLHGTIEYVLKDDKKTSTSWGAKAHFAQEDGELKMDLYQVFLDTAAMSRAK